MTFDERKKIVDKFLEWEAKYPVHNWTVEGIHFWPVLKINLFLTLFAGENKKKKAPKSEGGFLKKRISRVLRYLNALRLVWFFPSQPKTILFCGATTYRANVLPAQNKLHYNRYFDPLMDELEIRNIDAGLVEYYPIDLAPVYKKHRVAGLHAMLPYFSKHKRRTEETGLGFTDLLSEISATFNIPLNNLLKKINSVVAIILQWKALFGFVFDKVKPSYAVGLCYYSPAMYGMILAAAERKIVSVDMQHGGQGELHLAYTFNNVPSNGYNTLPSMFWCWDRQSFEHLQKMQFHGKHKVFLGGNPWLDFLNEMDTGLRITSDKPLILYTLQPLEPILDQYILNAIKSTKHSYQWWLRLHPLMDDKVKARLNTMLKENEVLDNVEVDKATRYPLPSILAQTKVHVSKYSGALIEAGMLGIPSLIIDEIGVRTFSDLISEKKATAVLDKDPVKLTEALQSLVAGNDPNTSRHDSVHYKQSVSELLTVDLKLKFV